jgi:hypothetical protein
VGFDLDAKLGRLAVELKVKIGDLGRAEAD